MRRLKTNNRNQLLLLPPNLNDWLPADHQARFLVKALEQLDLSKFDAKLNQSNLGAPAYDPQIILGILIYGYMIGISSSRRLEQATFTDVGLRFVAADMHPDHDTIAFFRRKHSKEIQDVFVQFVGLAVKANVVRLGHLAIDGTKMRSNASRNQRKTKEKLEVERERIRDLVKCYLDTCDADDAREDAEFGAGTNGYKLPAHLAEEDSLEEWIAEQLKHNAEQEAQGTTEEGDKGEPASRSESAGKKRLKRKEQKVERALTALDEQVEKEAKNDPTGRLRRKREKLRGARQVPKVNVTDVDSRLMRFSNGIFDEGYNCQIAVDDWAGIIVGADVVQDGGDQRQLLPMMLAVKQNTGWLPDNVTADNGYFNTEHLEDARLKSVEFYVKPNNGKCEKQADTKSQRMRERLETEIGSELYNLRKTIVEPVFGAIKQARKFRQFLLRGLEHVKTEWSLQCTAHNLKKMMNAGCAVAWGA